MKLIDMHCDTIWKLMDLDKKGDLADNDCSISIPGMKKAGTTVQVFACFAHVRDRKKGYDNGYQHVLEMIEFMKKQTELYADDIGISRSYTDIARQESSGKISAVLAVEEGGILNGKIERVGQLYKRGVRLITPIWNYENCLGFPNSTDRSVMWQGLKPFGIEAVRKMGNLGMIVDVSHASDGTFRDILQYASGPVVASHSNCRTICNHPRNLTDEMIRSLANRGGAAGLNFYGPFLGTANASRLEEMTEHILHMIRCGGLGFPMIGTDFDGFDGIEQMDIPKVECMERLWEALKKKGITESQLDKIWSGNALRILRSI